MRLNNILAIARLVAADPQAPTLERQCADYIVNLFGEPARLPPDVALEVYGASPDQPGQIILTREMVGVYTADEALAVARMLVAAAEQAR